MKKIALILFILVFLAGCAPAPTAAPLPTATEPPPPTNTVPPPTATQAPTDTPLPPTPTPGKVLLEVVGPEGSASLTLADLQSLPAQEGQAGIKSSTGRITLPAMYKGVALTDLADLVGGLDPSLGVNVVAKDGYAMTLSADQITNGDFIMYDPATGEEKKLSAPLTVILAYEREGEPISNNEEGPLRLAIISPENNQVTDGHWSVKWVNQIELKPLGAEWDLSMQGVIDKEIDRNSFQSCAAPGCHQATWKDEMAQTWTGVPLYLLAGQVDDEIEHEGPAFSDQLAEIGYLLQIVATDGYSTTLDSATVARNPDMIVAYQVNENPLPEKYFPLRLVGNAVEKSQSVGSIAEINLVVDPDAAATVIAAAAQPSPTATPEPAPPAEMPELAPGELLITGAVSQETLLSEEELKAQESVQIQAEHPKKGMQDYEGILLSMLLALAEPTGKAQTAAFIASDGYSAELPLADLAACSDCLLAFTPDAGVYQLVLPGFQSNFWVKGLAIIRLQ